MNHDGPFLNPPPVVMHITQPNRRDRRALLREIGATTDTEYREALAELINHGLIVVHPNHTGAPFRVWFAEARRP